MSVGCAKKTEEERLAGFRTSMKYRAYRLASKKAVELAVAEYNKETEAESAIRIETVHGVLGVLWLLADKPEFSCVEADVYSELRGEEPLLALGLRTVALHKMKMPSLSALEYEKIKTRQAAAAGQTSDDIETDDKIALLAIIFIGLREGEDSLTKFGADSLGAVSDLDYVSPLVMLTADVRNGRLIQAGGKLNELRKSERFSGHISRVLDEFKRVLAEYNEQGEIPENVSKRLLSALIQGVMADIFEKEHKGKLLEQAKQLTQTLGGESEPAKTEEVEGQTPSSSEKTDK
jgi:hypothetical protein